MHGMLREVCRIMFAVPQDDCSDSAQPRTPRCGMPGRRTAIASPSRPTESFWQGVRGTCERSPPDVLAGSSFTSDRDECYSSMTSIESNDAGTGTAIGSDML